VIAEAGVNHDGSLDTAKRLVEAARDAGADAVKFQAFRTDRLVTRGAPKAAYQAEQTGSGGQREMLKALEFSPAQFRELFVFAETVGIPFLASPFDPDSLGVLLELGVPALKLGSGELTDLPLLRKAAQGGIPLIVSTGMADEEEIAEALSTIEGASAPALPVVLLHAVSSYPCPLAEANVRALATLASTFGRPVGYSDHTLGEAASLAAVALGACVIEKHLTLDQGMEGPDHAASMEPSAFADLVRKVRALPAILGSGEKRPQRSELATRAAARKSLVADCDISAGTLLTSRMVAAKRPGTGLAPKRLWDFLGRVAKRDIREDTLLTEEMFE
jgi:N-acetylneuraminate synthase/N,N'-diacetyllegionaminate synthase